MKRVVFVEDEHQVNKALLELDNLHHSVALGLKAVYALEKQEKKFVTLDRYAPDAVIDQKEKQIIKKVEPFYIPDGEFLDLVHKHKDLIIDVGGYLLSRLVVQVEITLFKLKKYIEVEHPDEIVCFSCVNRDEFSAGGYQIVGLYKRCLRLLARDNNISFRELEYGLPTSLTDTEPAPHKSSSWSHEMIRRLRAFVHRLITPKASCNRFILFLSLAYDLEFLARCLGKKAKYETYLYNCLTQTSIDQEPEPLDAPAVKKALRDEKAMVDFSNLELLANTFWEELNSTDWFRNFFFCENINYFALLQDDLKIVFRNNILQLNLFYQKHLEMLKRYKISLIISPYPKINPVATSLWHAANNLGIPFAIYQHGGIYGYMILHRFILFEFRYDSFISYGAGIKEQLHWSGINFDNVYPVGSLKMYHYRRHPPGNPGKLRRELSVRKNQKLVIYVSDIIRPAWAGHVQLNLSVTVYKLQKRLVNFFSQIPDIRFVIKVHKSDIKYNPIVNYLADRNIPNCIVRCDPSFLEYIPASDLIIVDHPGTAFLEALSLEVPLCVYTSGFKIYPEFEEELKRCTLFTNDLDEFITGLREKVECLLQGQVEIMGKMDLKIRESVIRDDKSVPERVDKAIDTLFSASPTRSPAIDNHICTSHE